LPVVDRATRGAGDRDGRRRNQRLVRALAEHTEDLRVRVLEAAAEALAHLVLAALRGLVAEEPLTAAVGAVRHRIVARARAVEELELVIEAVVVRRLLAGHGADFPDAV